MQKYYELQLDGEQVGTVTVEEEGLYYRFRCTCHLPGDVVYRLGVRCGEVRENLGVLVPQENVYVLDKKLPVRHLMGESMQFFLCPKHDKLRGKFVPVCPEEPFSYISRLKDAFLSQQNGKMGLLIRESGVKY